MVVYIFYLRRETKVSASPETKWRLRSYLIALIIEREMEGRRERERSTERERERERPPSYLYQDLNHSGVRIQAIPGILRKIVKRPCEGIINSQWEASQWGQIRPMGQWLSNMEIEDHRYMRSPANKRSRLIDHSIAVQTHLCIENITWLYA